MVQVAVGEPIGAGVGNIGAGNFSKTDAEQLAETIQDRFLVRVAKDAAGCCIDGRHCTHTMGETAPVPGPSVAGGPSITGYAAAEMVGDYFGDTSAPTSLGRLNEVGSTLVRGGIRLGAHVAESVLDETGGTFVGPDGLAKTGCGASDKFKEIIHRTADSPEALFETTKALLGDEEFVPVYASFRDSAALERRVDGYDPREAVEAIAQPAAGRNVEILEGGHEELLVVFNYVEGTTIDRDALVEETGKQVFVVDMWYIDKLAHVMAEGRPDAPEMYQKLRHAMTAFQVATYLTLCDGTHRPVLITQPQHQEAIATPN